MGEHSSDILQAERKAEEAKAQAAFEACDWSVRTDIVKLFPAYAQIQYEYRSQNKKNVSKVVDIECFTLKTPFGDQVLLKDTPLHLEPNSRQCLYGANSTGKTLLFSNISEGKIKDFPKHLHVHHCKELETHELHDTVLGTVVNAHPLRNILVKCEKKLRELIDTAAENNLEGEKLSAIKDNLDWVKMQMEQLRGYDTEDRAKKMLRVLGFDDAGQAKLCSALSGGLRMRVALAMAFINEADMLLLDEPTNHLDFPSVLWLENRLRGYKGSFLLVTHDRELLNNVVTGVLLLEDKQIKYYQCGFKEFEKRKAADDKKKFEEIEKFLQRNLNADPSTMQGKLRHEKKQWSDNYYARQVALAGKFTFPKAEPLSNTEKDENGNPLPPEKISLINLQNVRFSYNPDLPDPVFIFNTPISFNVMAGTRCGVMGPNGAGKSTLLKLLTKKLIPTEGTVVHHPKYELAYFGQHSTAELNLDQTPIEWMCQQFPDESTGALRGHLAKTGIVGGTADTRMQRLSFSQRSCIIFAKLTLRAPHLLILDEPTNFLDLESVDSLISACNKYPGALLLVSHNRDFLKKCAKEYLSVVPGHFNIYPDLKTAERSTYTFIQEMEEGGKVGASALQNCPGGGAVHSSQKVGGTAAAAPAFSGVIGANGAGASVLKAGAGVAKAAAGPVTYAVNEKVSALWTDGKWYPAVIKKVDGAKYTVLYTQYGNTTTLTEKSLKKAAAPAAGAKPAAGAAAAAKKK